MLKRMNNYSIRGRLMLMVAINLVLLAVVGGTGIMAIRASEAGVQHLYDQRLQSTWQIGNVYALVQNNLLAYRAARDAGTTSAARDMNARFAANREKINGYYDPYLAMNLGRDERRAAEHYDAERTLYHDYLKQGFGMMEAGDFAGADRHLATKIMPQFAKLDAMSSELLQMQLDGGNVLRGELMDAVRSDLVMIVALFVTGLVVSLTFGGAILASMRRSIDAVMDLVGHISNGRLGNRVTVEGRDELARILGTLAEMDNRLHEIVRDVRTSADSVSAAARQLSAGNDDLSQRTQEQAASLEETASSMEEMAATVKQNAGNAREANALAAAARDQAETGSHVVGNAVGAMREISASSRKIAAIIGVIDEIAFQTNLLALNAAVEAARAGEQGRGFAVVATEVRNLAQRSASAAREIKELINDSVSKVAGGTKLVEDSGGALATIRDSVRKVTAIVGDIANASVEQSSGIDQVNRAVTQMDHVTQQNAALVEEAAAASRSMEEQARALLEKVAFFTLVEDGVSHATHPRAPQAARTIHPGLARARAAAALQ